METFKFNSKKDKKWIENYWFYYKIHTIVGIFAVIILIFSLVECANKVYPDLTVSYIGEKVFSEEVSDRLKQTFEGYIDDATNNGKIDVEFMPLTVSKEAKSEPDMAMMQKAQLEIAAGETYLYILDKAYFDQYQKEGLFINVADQLGKSGEVYGVSLNNSAVFSSLGIKSNADLYACVRVITLGNQKKAKDIAQQNNAIKVLKKLAE